MTLANHRMFSIFVTGSDNFLDMPLTTQALYFHLGMSGDDEGFISNPKKIQRSIGASDDDMKLLILKGFVIPFDTGILVVTHWNINNHIRKDRKRDTVFFNEKKQIFLCENGLYSIHNSSLATNCQPTDNQLTTKCPPSIVQDNEDSIGESKNKPDSSKPTRHKYGAYKNVLLSDDELLKLRKEMPNYSGYIENLSEYMASTGKKYKSHFATIRSWARKDNAKVQKTDTQTEYRDYFELVKDGEL